MCKTWVKSIRYLHQQETPWPKGASIQNQIFQSLVELKRNQILGLGLEYFLTQTNLFQVDIFLTQPNSK